MNNRDWRGQVDRVGNLYVSGDRHDDGDGETICTAVCVVSGNLTSGTLTAANARLIAAAPDLFEACWAALSTSPCVFDDNKLFCLTHKVKYPCPHRMLSAAIAKALGAEGGT